MFALIDKSVANATYRAYTAYIVFLVCAIMSFRWCRHLTIFEIVSCVGCKYSLFQVVLLLHGYVSARVWTFAFI